MKSESVGTVRVVEVSITYMDPLKSENLARFVLLPDGTVRVVELGLDGIESVDEFILKQGVIASDGSIARLEDGEKFLLALPMNVRGTFYAASEVFEMPLEEALKGWKG